jgi:hypothetical protein
MHHSHHDVVLLSASQPNINYCPVQVDFFYPINKAGGKAETPGWKKHREKVEGP